MPREVITLQVGQAGNQIGRRFWEQALEEHCQPDEDDDHGELKFTDSMSSFFHLHDNDDLICGTARKVRDRIVKPGALKARAVLVDMEEGPVTETLRGPLRGLFDSHQSLTDVSGAGNNFAHGHHCYGPQYGESVLEAVRQAAELCDSLQSFFLMHSLGGGTGSGLGTYILTLLEDEFPQVHRFVTAIFPSEDDDVVTSPYNSVLALQQLTAHADCVLPVENQSLMTLAAPFPWVTRSGSTVAGFHRPSTMDRLLAPPCPPVGLPKEGKMRPLPRPTPTAAPAPAAAALRGAAGGLEQAAERPACGFDGMNDLVARLLLDLTASMRFGGELNVDLNEITTNLVPYPRLHYLMSSLSLSSSTGTSRNNAQEWEPLGSAQAAASLHLRQICSKVFARENQLLRADPRQGSVLACALLFRGQELSLADVTENVKKLQREMNMASWNKDGFKIGLCQATGSSSSPTSSGPPPPPSLLSLTNNSCVTSTFLRLLGRFQKLYRRRAMVHHYAEYMDVTLLEEAREDLRGLIEEYHGVGARGKAVGRRVIGCGAGSLVA